jgi:hypothetical protein
VSNTYIPIALRRLVEQRASLHCEYCRLPDGLVFFPHEIDHIIAEKHGGATEGDNLAFTCFHCNRRKGSDLGTFDPDTGQFCLLFNPRTQVWAEHFKFEGFTILGLTPEGRATVSMLQINSEETIAERRRIKPPRR